MALQQHSESAEKIVIMLEFVPEDEQDVDSAEVSAFGRAVVDALRNDGYTVIPAYTGQRGGVLFEVITFLENVPSDIWMHRDVIETISALSAILTNTSPLVRRILEARKAREAQRDVQEHPATVTIKIDDKEVTVTDSDLEQLVSVAKRLITESSIHKNQISPKSKIQVKHSVPNPHPRRKQTKR